MVLLLLDITSYVTLLQKCLGKYRTNALFSKISKKKISKRRRNDGKEEEARLDVSAVSFWMKGKRTFFDLSAQRYRNHQELAKYYETSDKEKSIQGEGPTDRK